MDYYTKRDKRRAVCLAVGLVILWWFAQVPYTASWIPLSVHDNALQTFHYISIAGFPGQYVGSLTARDLHETNILILFGIGGAINLLVFGLPIFILLRSLSVLIGERRRYDKL